METRLHLFLFAVLLSGGTGLAHAGEIYQWLDSRGGIHFTDDYYAIPVQLRDSAQLIVRTDLRNGQTRDSSTTGRAPIQAGGRENPEDERANGGEDSGPNSRYVYTSSENFAPSPDATVIVVDNSTSDPRQIPCRGSRVCSARFWPDFNDRQYIHPSVFNGRSRAYVHRGRFRSVRK